MNKVFRLFAQVSLIAAVTGCANAQDCMVADEKTAQTIRDLLAQQAGDYVNLDAEKTSAPYADKLWWGFASGPMISGREIQIERYKAGFKANKEKGVKVLNMDYGVKQVTQCGDAIYVDGTYEITSVKDEEKSGVRFNYSILMMQEEEDIKIHGGLVRPALSGE